MLESARADGASSFPSRDDKNRARILRLHATRVPPSVLAFVAYWVIALSLTGPALFGNGSLLPEWLLDRDLLYAKNVAVPKQAFEDTTPVQLELARERAVAAGLGQGRLDTWNPWVGAGAPLWAEQGNPFFPTKFLYYIAPSHATYAAALAARLIVAALGMYVLGILLGLPAWSAIFAGALFEYSGILAAELPFADTSATYMMPWILAAAQKLTTQGGMRNVGLAGLALGIAALGGHPSFILLSGLAFAAWIAGELVRKRPPPREALHEAGLVLAAGGIAMLIAAAALLPFAELVLHGETYKTGAIADVIWRGRLHVTRNTFLMSSFVPSLITATRDAPPYFLWWPFAEGGSIGLVALLLAVRGAPKLREHWGLALLGALGIGLTFAPFGLQVLHQIPGIRIILPWYCYALVLIPLSLLAGFGLDAIARAPQARLLAMPAVYAIVSAGGVLIVYSALALLGGPHLLSALKNQVGRVWSYSDWFYVAPRFVANWQTYLSPAFAMLALAAYAPVSRFNTQLAAGLVALIAIVEAGAARIPTMAFDRSAVLTSGPSEATAKLQTRLADGSWRFVGVPVLRVAVPNTAALFRLRDFRSVAALSVRREAEVMALSGPPADPEVGATMQYPENLNVPLISLAAVRYVAASERAHKIPSALRKQETVGRVALYENPFALPRFRITHDVIAATDEREALARLKTLLATPQWRTRTVIEGVASDASRGPRTTDDGEYVRRTAEPDPETIMLDARLNAPGFVLVADTFYPGWTAWVDDKPAAIHPADVQFRAVAVPKGTHRIVMKYASAWLTTGETLSAFGLLLALLLIGSEGARRRVAPGERAR